MKFRITEEHIKRGAPHNKASCPVALALLDFPDVIKAEVTYSDIRIQTTSDYFVVPTPVVMSTWIMDFDQYRKGEPMEVELELKSTL